MPSKRTREAMRAVALEFLQLEFTQSIPDKVSFADISTDLVEQLCKVMPKGYRNPNYFRDRQRLRKVVGKCHSCPADSQLGRAYCKQCGKMALLAQSIRRRQCIQDGIYLRCKLPQVAERIGFLQCLSCQQVKQEASKDRLARRKDSEKKNLPTNVS